MSNDNTPGPGYPQAGSPRSRSRVRSATAASSRYWAQAGFSSSLW
jgi:hypothetical protein